MKKRIGIFCCMVLFPWFVVIAEGADEFTTRMTEEFYETSLNGELLSVSETEALILDLLKQGGSGVSFLEDVPEVSQMISDRLLGSLNEYFDDTVTLDGLILLGIFGMFQEGHTLIDNFSFVVPIQQGVVPAEVSSLSLFFQAEPPLSMDYSNMYGNIWFDYSVRNQKYPSFFVSFCAGVFDFSLQCALHVVDGSTYVTFASSGTDLLVLETKEGSAKVILETEYEGRTPVGNVEGNSDLRVTYDILDISGDIAYTGTYTAQQDLGFNYFGALDSFISKTSLGLAP